ncbi:hypothetical protein DYB32_009272 [Aphanomyces invadans]|uniref:DDE-1 domain-containing protein n=1 Tax=Aphanomyces invadans TaxID=157072 RepID=A0A418AIT1_9STRA|nr:hypothetical protein DYB32_009272 [Aphanomyces invadans]
MKQRMTLVENHDLRVPGTKKSKKRITIVVTTNDAGIDRINALFIGSAANPRCFSGQSAEELGFIYKSSKKGRMNANIFNSYLESIDTMMVDQDRKVLILVDDAPPQ